MFVENIINDHPTTRVYLMPKILQPGTNDFFVFLETKELFVNEPGKRFLFYRGIQWDSLHGSYPLGTPDVYDQEGNKIAEANLALKWEGEYGLYNQLWKPVIENFILKTRTVEIERLFTAVEIRNFDFSEKVRVKGVDYLVKEIKIPITDRAILPASMTCYKV